MEKCEARAVTKYLYLIGLTQQKIFYGMKEKPSRSARAYSTLQSGMLNFHDGDSRVKTGTIMDDRQLLSTKKLLKKSTNLS